ncbi:hypothetical protein CLU79DRAFT_833087 [Phycomyces nitens]|nr:hypothetical protein CLU79DRAFT_833087 [Phycomyces nitens]
MSAAISTRRVQESTPATPRNRRVSDFERGVVVGRYMGKMEPADIAVAQGLPRQVVDIIIKLHLETGDLSERKFPVEPSPPAQKDSVN